MYLNLDSLNNSWKDELNRYRHSGITAETLLKHALGVSDNEMETLKADIMNMAVHNTGEYKALATEFHKKAQELETGMYEPFAGMANTILARHRNDSTPHRVKVLPFTGNNYVKGGRYGERKPDV